jgi:hypothetical protein
MSWICPRCGGALFVADDNGVTDPARGVDRVEYLACEREGCAYERTEVLPA